MQAKRIGIPEFTIPEGYGLKIIPGHETNEEIGN
jgi:hypothetical protein